MTELLFPRGIASGEAFCNRVQERRRLAQNLKTGQHTLLVSPRRYGKTSLVKYVIQEMKLPYGEADLFIAIDAKQVGQSVLSGTKMILNQINSSLEQTLMWIRNYFKTLNSKWIIGTQGVQIALVPEEGADIATTILEALLVLEDILSKKKIRAVLFLDEIQELGFVAEGKGIEGAIRHAAQKSKYLSLVFSGSSRHLLTRMFFDKERPLYKLCDRITLERIKEEDYEDHLQKMARKKWKKELSGEILTTIFQVTELHPFYLNNICSQLWCEKIVPQSAEQVFSIWKNLVYEERLEIAKEFSTLSLGQRKVLMLIAFGHQEKLTGKDFLRRTNMTSSSVVDALKILEQKDYIQKHGSQYVIIDPLIKTTLCTYYSDEK